VDKITPVAEWLNRNSLLISHIGKNNSRINIFKDEIIIISLNKKYNMLKKLEKGLILNDRYELVEEIGAGGFAVVWKACDRLLNNKEFAIKIYARLDDHGLELFKKEYLKVHELQHPYLLRAEHYDNFDGRPFLIMPFCEGGSLFNRIQVHGPLPESEILCVLNDISNALAYLHKEKKFHGDIKPGNVLIDASCSFLLSDFGESGVLESTNGEARDAGAVTPCYSAPERFLQRPKFGSPADIFSLGVMIYKMATSELPWAGMGGRALLDKKVPLPELPEGYSTGLTVLMQQCLNRDTQKRPCAQQVFDGVQKLRGVELKVILPPVELVSDRNKGLKADSKKLKRIMAVLISSFLLPTGGYVLQNYVDSASSIDNNSVVKSDSTRTVYTSTTIYTQSNEYNTKTEPVELGWNQNLRDKNKPQTISENDSSIINMKVDNAYKNQLNEINKTKVIYRTVKSSLKAEINEYDTIPNWRNQLKSSKHYRSDSSATQSSVDSTPKKKWIEKYSWVAPFREDLAKVCSGGHCGFVDNNGNVIIPLVYESAESFFNGRALVKKNGKYGLINPKGKNVTSLIYDSIWPYTYGRARVSKDNKYGFIDYNGIEIINLSYRWAGSFQDGLAYVQKGRKYGYIDVNDSLVIPAIYHMANDFIEGRAKVKKEGRSFFIDKNGNRLPD
jgi:serine/threonine protein kinase